MQITLREARVTSGFTQEDVANHCVITVQELEEYGKDCTDMPVNVAVKIRKLTDFPWIIFSSALSLKQFSVTGKRQHCRKYRGREWGEIRRAEQGLPTVFSGKERFN